MGRRRRKKIRRVKVVRRPRRYFNCPVCGELTLTVEFKKSEAPGVKTALVRCGSCKLYLSMEVPEALERVDVYNKVVDLAYAGELERVMEEAAANPSVEEGIGVEEESPRLPPGEAEEE